MRGAGILRRNSITMDEEASRDLRNVIEKVKLVERVWRGVSGK